jgi:hypothetical protein
VRSPAVSPAGCHALANLPAALLVRVVVREGVALWCILFPSRNKQSVFCLPTDSNAAVDVLAQHCTPQVSIIATRLYPLQIHTAEIRAVFEQEDRVLPRSIPRKCSSNLRKPVSTTERPYEHTDPRTDCSRTLMLSPRYLLAWAAAVLCLCWVAGAAAADGDVEPAGQAGTPAHWKHGCGLLQVCNKPEACPIMRETPPEQFTVRFKTNVGSFRVSATLQLSSCQSQLL